MSDLILYLAAIAAASALFAEAAAAISGSGTVRLRVIGAHLLASLLTGFILAWGLL